MPDRPQEPSFQTWANDIAARLRAVERQRLRLPQGEDPVGLQTFEDGEPLGPTRFLDFGAGISAVLTADGYVTAQVSSSPPSFVGARIRPLQETISIPGPSFSEVDGFLRIPGPGSNAYQYDIGAFTNIVSSPGMEGFYIPTTGYYEVGLNLRGLSNVSIENFKIIIERWRTVPSLAHLGLNGALSDIAEVVSPRFAAQHISPNAARRNTVNVSNHTLLYAGELVRFHYYAEGTSTTFQIPTLTTEFLETVWITLVGM